MQPQAEASHVLLPAIHEELRGRRSRLPIPAAAAAVSSSSSRTLHEAAESGDVVALRRLVASGADVNEPDLNGERPLHRAAGYGSVAAVRTLVELGAGKNVKDFRGATPLHYAAHKGQADAAKLLVELGADKEARSDDGATPLHYAAGQGKVAAILVLMELHVDSGARTWRGSGETPLQLCLRYNHQEAARVLSAVDAAQAKVRSLPAFSHLRFGCRLPCERLLFQPTPLIVNRRSQARSRHKDDSQLHNESIELASLRHHPQPFTHEATSAKRFGTG